MPTYRTTISFRDARGQIGKSGFYSSAATLILARASAAAAVPALQALSNAAPNTVSGPAATPPAAIAYGAAAVYQNAEDHAALTFEDVIGSLHRVRIPAPLAAIFLADGETVNSANPLVIAAVAAMTDGVTSGKNTSPFTTFRGGQLIRGRFIRRFNVLTLDPALAGPGL